MRGHPDRIPYRALLCASALTLGISAIALPAAADGGGGDSPGGSASLPLPGDAQSGAGRQSEPPAGLSGRTSEWASEWRSEDRFSGGLFGGVADNGLSFGTRIEFREDARDARSAAGEEFGDFAGRLTLDFSGVTDNGLQYSSRVEISPAPPAEAASAPKGPPMMLRVDEATGEVSLLVRNDFVSDGVPDFEAAARAYRAYYGSDPPFRVPPNPRRPAPAAAPPVETGLAHPQGTPVPNGTARAGDPIYFTPRFTGLDLGLSYEPSRVETQIRGALQSEDNALLEAAIREFGTPEARAELERQKAAANQAAPRAERAGGRR